MKEAGYVVFGIYVIGTVWLLVNALMQVHLWRLSRKRVAKKHGILPEALPFVSIQLPVYNEKYVVEGLLESVAGLDYPAHLFQILVLDDSTDQTSGLIDLKIAELKEKGLSVEIIRRRSRIQYKAGALQESLSYCKGELIAIFDADFRPEPSFLKNLIPHFSDKKVGLVQARWGHLNSTQNFLTRIQTFLLDTYFSIEQAGRNNGGYFSNFCGTAGIWRKECILEAGGWDGHVLSEDLDLSYRAQLKGWKIVFDERTEVPAEIPSEVGAFKIQQFRWTKGIMQVFQKNWNAVAQSSFSIPKKLHAFFHLLSSFIFPCLLINGILSLPLLLLRHHDPIFITLTNYTAVGGLNLILLTFIYYQGVKEKERDAQFSKYYPLFLVVYMGMSVQNTVAVFQGIKGKKSAFLRTPKKAESVAISGAYSAPKMKTTQVLEMVMLVYFMLGVSLSFYLGDLFFLPLFLMMIVGLGILIFHSYPGSKDWLRLSKAKFSWR